MSDGGDSLMEFPCEIPMKIFGRNSAGFRETVLTIMRAHYDDIRPQQFDEQPSRRGTYVSITVTVTAVSREQIDRVYQDLTASEAVLMVL